MLMKKMRDNVESFDWSTSLNYIDVDVDPEEDIKNEMSTVVYERITLKLIRWFNNWSMYLVVHTNFFPLNFLMRLIHINVLDG